MASLMYQRRVRERVQIQGSMVVIDQINQGLKRYLKKCPVDSPDTSDCASRLSRDVCLLNTDKKEGAARVGPPPKQEERRSSH